MKNHGACAYLSDCGKGMAKMLTSVLEKGGDGIAALYAAAAAWLGGLVISEATMAKTFLISVGIIIGATFSDFIKKHRCLFLLVAVAALAAFLYKTFMELEDDEAF